MASQFISIIIENLKANGCDRSGAQPPCVERLKLVLAEAAIALGYQFFRFSYRNKSAANFRGLSPGFHLSSFPPAWEEKYLEGKLFQYDPVYRFTGDPDSFEFTDHGYWTQLIDKALSNPIDIDGLGVNHYRQRALRVYSEAAEHGVHSGIYYHIATEEYAGHLNLASPVDTETPVNWSEIRAGTLILGDILNTIYGCAACARKEEYSLEGGSSSLLSKAEAEVLKLYYENPGAGQKQVAELKNCTPDNIKMHLKNIRKKFDLERVSGHQLARMVRNQYFL